MHVKPTALLLITIMGIILLFSGVEAASFEEGYQKGRVLYLEEKYTEAAEIFSRLTSQYPKHSLVPDALFWLGECYLAQKRYQEAVRKFELVTSLAPDSPRAPDALLEQAYSLSRLGEHEAAASALKKLLKNYPGTPAAHKAKEASDELPEVRAARVALGEKAIQIKAATGMSDIMSAVAQNDLATFKIILAKFPYVVEFRDRQGRTPLHLAAALNRTHMAKLLLDKGADVNADSRSYVFIYTPLHEAAKSGSIETAESLIANGAKIDKGEYIRRKEWAEHFSLTPLHLAVKHHRLEMVKLLLEKGADP
ncbi:MAG: tol-pal system protein YbgF, partial [Deltaproteobacteria bacterium]|nr:tol-pal system protein YbgF [Deltaproteobacteria bacterium]